MLESLEIENGPLEIAQYIHDNRERFYFTVNLCKDLRGECLELGAAPFGMTILLKQIQGLHLTLANYYGPNQPDEIKQRISYDGKSEILDIWLFNIEEGAPFRDASFDSVVCCEVFEHFATDPIHALREMRRILKPTGTLLLTTPNAVRAENVTRMLQGANFYDHYSNYGPLGRHNREYTIYELQALMQYCGFSVEVLETMDFQPRPSIPKLDRDDLGATIIVKANATHTARSKRPDWLYRGHNDTEPLAVQMPNDIIQGGYLLDGWHGLESWEGILTRWMGEKAHIRTNGARKLRFKVMSFFKPRTLEIEGFRQEIPTHFIEVSMALNSNNIITMESLNCSDSPKKINGSDDVRELCFALQTITIY
jgi:SAM-dependent methyltransferase